MRRFGKRLFTRPCKDGRPRINAEDRGLKKAVRLRLDRLFCLWWKGVFAGGFRENSFLDMVVFGFGCGGLGGEGGLFVVGF